MVSHEEKSYPLPEGNEAALILAAQCAHQTFEELQNCSDPLSLLELTK
jgi:hypothetical protein